eukprot:IDg23360t1
MESDAEDLMYHTNALKDNYKGRHWRTQVSGKCTVELCVVSQNATRLELLCAFSDCRYRIRAKQLHSGSGEPWNFCFRAIDRLRGALLAKRESLLLLGVGGITGRRHTRIVGDVRLSVFLGA